MQHLPIERELELLGLNRDEHPPSGDVRIAERVVRASTLRLVLSDRLKALHEYHADPSGLVLKNLKVLGQLDLNDLRIDLSLCFHGCTIESGFSAAYSSVRRLEFLNCTVGGRGNGDQPPLNLRFAHIDGALNLSGSTVRAFSAPAVDARNAYISGDVLLRYGPSRQTHYANEEDPEGTISFVFAQIGGSVILHQVRARNKKGPAFNISNAEIKGDVNFEHSCSLTGSSGAGVLQIVGATLNGQLDLGNSLVTNDTGPALNIRGAIITEDLYIKEGFTATGGTDRGVVRLLQADIGGRVWVRGATIKNDSNAAGAALNCEDIHVKRSFTIQKYGDHECTLMGAGDSATVRLSGATIEGQLAIADVAISNPSGPAFTASQARISSGLLLRGLTVSSGGRRGAIRLAGTRVDGMLSVDFALIERAVAGDTDKWDVDGLTYTGYPDVAIWNTHAAGGKISADGENQSAVSVVIPKLSRIETDASKSFSRWLDLLTKGTTEYAAQPYQHMATIARVAGHETEARRALKEQRRAREDCGRLTQWNKYWSKFYGFSLGYGYESWRPLFGLVVNIIIALSLIFLLFPASIEPTPVTAYRIKSQALISPVPAKPQEVCRAGDRFLLSLDISLPLVRLYGDQGCTVDPNAPALFSISIVIVQLLGWAAATLFVAGFAGVIRRA